MEISLLGTEILLATLGFLALVTGLLPGRAKSITGSMSLAGLLLILVYTIAHFGEEASLFQGIYLVDNFAAYFKMLFLTATLLVSLGAGRYLERFENKKSEFYSLMVFATLGMVIMASAGDFITLYVGLELMTVSFYILTAFLLRDGLSTEAGLKYLVLGAASSAILLFGISLVMAYTGTTVIGATAARLMTEPAVVAGIVLLAAGFAFKISVIPFHMWTPDIYQGAPTPVTNYLSVASKAAAFAAMVRVFMVAVDAAPGLTLSWNLILAILAALTIIVGNLIALVQEDIKRLLAYSSIAQAGYILAGLAAANAYGLKGVLFYALLYVFCNTGAFIIATAVEVDSGSTAIEAFRGLSKRSPALAAIMTICLLSLAGIPPLAGFVGKFYLFAGAIQQGYLWLALIGLIMSMVSVYYYLNVSRVMYIEKAGKQEPVKGSGAFRLALWVCALAAIFLGCYPAPLSNLAQQAIQLFL
ncbi:MAG: NADH-quinone oxidoreductase subunit N [Syntrophomonadaceae bacterium]|nr:NADH-quinone oxidoreductase subunit N [Syntrophomonadaceae bacterium]